MIKYFLCNELLLSRLILIGKIESEVFANKKSQLLPIRISMCDLFIELLESALCKKRHIENLQLSQQLDLSLHVR